MTRIATYADARKLRERHAEEMLMMARTEVLNEDRNRFRMSSTGEELSKYSADDPRSARAVSKLGVVGPELDGNSPGSPSTTSATSLASALRAPSNVVQALASTQRFFHNVQRTLRSPFDILQPVGPLEPVALFDHFPMLRIGVPTFVL